MIKSTSQVTLTVPMHIWNLNLTHTTKNRSRASRVIGTNGNIAPKPVCRVKLKADIAKQACDIFSIGVILWKMMNAIHPKPFKQARHLITTFVCCKINSLIHFGVKITVMSSISTNLTMRWGRID